ncbi:MAG: DNA gyrase inhibitor YacG [Deltaproteobacteria bacterium]|nr:DNA gyrase inhibitor YacG [Candidatus Zymogenaceae bacterium]
MTKKRTEGVRCPRCDTSARDEFFPFCSDRCRLIDLARWINGDYRIPAEDVTDEETGTVVRRENTVIH